MKENELNPYKVLNVTEKSLESHKENLKIYLEQRAREMLDLGGNPEKINKAYDILSNDAKRNQYLTEKQKNDYDKNIFLNRTYNFKEEFDESLIKEVRYKEVRYSEDETRGIDIEFNDGKKVRLKVTGEIEFENCVGLQSKILEFEVSKFEKDICSINKAKVYTNISLPELSEDNLEYAKYVLTNLLSDERIKACTKFNHGYLGEIEKDSKTGKYSIEINKEPLSAVMKHYGEKSKEINEDRNVYKPKHAIDEGENIVGLGDLSYNPRHAIDDDNER